MKTSKLKVNELEDHNKELKGKISSLEIEKNVFEATQAKLERSIKDLQERNKNEVNRLKSTHDNEIEEVQDRMNTKVEQENRKVNEIIEELEKVKLERDKLEKENSINSRDFGRTGKNKDAERVAEKLKEKVKINEEIFKEQLQILENENGNLKKETEKHRSDER